MLYNPPSGSASPNAPYVGKNVAAGTQGSKVPPAAVENTQREIVNAITAAGLTPTNGDLTQLAQAIAKIAAAGSVKSAARFLAVQIFLVSGTYIPTAGMTEAEVLGTGAGGAGAGCTNPGAGLASSGSPGGNGTSGRAILNATQIGASQAVLVGLGGASALSSAGANGGATGLGPLVNFPGGLGGQMFNGGTPPFFNGNGSIAAAASGTPGANIFSQRGSTPDRATVLSANAVGMFVGPGGSGLYGNSPPNTANTNGPDATGYGAGGAGTACAAGGGPAQGGKGAPGILIIIERGVVS